MNAQPDAATPDSQSVLTMGGASVSAPIDDLVTATLSLVIVLALYLDGRAHWLALPDSFFTPWHALLYGGLLALGGWILLLGVRRSAGSASRRSAFAPPPGYGLALVGAVVFASGGVADGIWHSVFGIEEGIDALLSPSHLILFAGASLLFSGPIRTYRQQASACEPLRRVAVTLAVLAISAVAGFALSYLSAFTTTAPTKVVGHFPEGTARHIATEMQASVGLASYLITSLVIVFALIFLARTGGLMTGAVTLFLTAHATLSLMLVNYSVLGLGLILTTAAAGLSIDFARMVFAKKVAGSQHAQVFLVAALTPLAIIASQMVALSARFGVKWSPELIGGVLVLSSMLLVAALTAATQRGAGTRYPAMP